MTHVKGTSITTSLQLMEALALARRGRVREAEATLTRGGALPEDPLRLQALAALTTSEGDYERALALWRLVLVRHPEHREARKMVASIELWLSRPPWFRFIPIFAALSSVALLVVGLSWVFSEPPPPPRRPVPIAPAISPVASPVVPASHPADLPRIVLPTTPKKR